MEMNILKKSHLLRKIGKRKQKQENIYKENALEKKRLDLEIKIKKVKNLIQSLSNDLKITINQIDNNNLDINVL